MPNQGPTVEIPGFSLSTHGNQARYVSDRLRLLASDVQVVTVDKSTEGLARAAATGEYESIGIGPGACIVDAARSDDVWNCHEISQGPGSYAAQVQEGSGDSVMDFVDIVAAEDPAFYGVALQEIYGIGTNNEGPQ